MAGITAAMAQTQLDHWISISTSIGANKSVTIDDRVFTKHDLSQVTEQIDYWNRMLCRLSRGSGVSLSRIIVND